MADGDGNGRILTWALGLITAIALTLSSFSMAWVFNANADIKLLSLSVENLTTLVQSVVTDNEADVKQDETLRKFWKLHTWEKSRVTELRHLHGLDLAEWPDLGS